VAVGTGVSVGGGRVLVGAGGRGVLVGGGMGVGGVSGGVQDAVEMSAMRINPMKPIRDLPANKQIYRTIFSPYIQGLIFKVIRNYIITRLFKSIIPDFSGIKVNHFLPLSKSSDRDDSITCWFWFRALLPGALAYAKCGQTDGTG
jgi:hypothetical protein